MECQWLTGLSAGDGLSIFRRLNQCESAGDGFISTESAGVGEKRLQLTGPDTLLYFTHMFNLHV